MKKRVLTTLLAAVTILAMCFGLTACGGSSSESASTASDSPVAVANTGTYTGVDNDGVQEFKGIRYGNFEAYKPATDVTTTSEDQIDATEWGANCIQPWDETETASQDECSQDCLFLNVWTKDTDTKDKPVIVWIHGGSYIWGGATDPLYHGAAFVRNLPDGEDCVFVTIKYRLSIMGGLDLSSLDGYTDDYADSWNLSKLDQTQALKWVSENIEAFGGDADNVTIMGHSSGGAAVQMLMADPDSNQYFNRVIENSGVQASVAVDDETFKERSKEVLDILGVSSIDELTSLTDDQIADKISEINDKVDGIGNRAADGEVISETWWDDLKEGSAKDIDLMIGSVNGEEDWDSIDWDNSVSDPITDSSVEYNALKDTNETYKNTYGRLLPFLYDGVVDEYLKVQTEENDQDDVEAIQSLVNDMSAGYPTLLTAEEQSKWNDNVYVYYWEYAPDKDEVVEYSGDAAEVSPWNRALHTMDVNFEFGNMEEGYPEQTGDPDKVPQELITQMQSAVYNFAKTGDPNNDNISEWKQFGEDENTMVVGLDQTWHCESDYRGNVMDVLKKVRPIGEKED